MLNVNANHYLWDCPNFKRKSVSERLQFMRQVRLCDNCAKRDHVSRYCLAKPACNVSGCTRRHHFLLHTEFGDSRPASSSAATRGSSDSTPQQSQGSTSNFSGATVTKSANNMCLNVVPVKISSGSKTVLSYAFLDQGSTATLCDERLLDLLQITGKPAKFAISTVNERADIHRGSKVNLTSINSLAGGEPLNLQNVLSVKRLPALRNQPLTKDELRAWPHLLDLDLHEIAGEVLFLIGVDAPEAFWVVEERRGNCGEPYAVRTTLGWSLMGPKSIDGGDFTSTGLGESVSINFVSTEDHLESQIERLWQLDIVPSSYGRQSLMSKEDRYALQMMEKSKTIVNGHYQVALPWRPGAPHLEDNYEQAKVRLSYLKGQLLKNPVLKERYVEFVDVVSSYISQGHAEQVSEKQAAT